MTVQHSWFIVSIGTALMGSCTNLLRSVCGTSALSAQCSATVVQLHSAFRSLCIQNGTIIFLFYCDKTVGQQQESRRELRSAKTVYGVRCLV